MDTPNWIKALGLSLQYPVLLIADFAILCAAFGFAWWLRGHWATDKIEALNQRLELAREQLAVVQSQLASALGQVADQEKKITELRQTRVEPAKVDRLAQSNTAIRNDLNVIVTSTTAVSHTLNVGRFSVAPLPEPSGTKRSG